MNTIKYIFEYLFESVKTEEAENFIKVYYQREQRKKFLGIISPETNLLLNENHAGAGFNAVACFYSAMEC